MPVPDHQSHSDGLPRANSVGEDIVTDYYIVAVDQDGDVMALRARLIGREGLDIMIRSSDATISVAPDAVAFDNQGDDDESKFESARDALASVLIDRDPIGDDDEDDYQDDEEEA